MSKLTRIALGFALVNAALAFVIPQPARADWTWTICNDNGKAVPCCAWCQTPECLDCP
jgi:hypothetical protein